MGGGEGMGDGEREGSGKGDREKGREKWEENNSNCVVAASRCSKLVEHSPTATSGGSIKDSLSHSIFVTPCELHFACSPSSALQAEGCTVRARAAEDTSPESSLPSVHIPLNEVVVVRYNGKSTTCRYVISVNAYNITIQVVGFIDTKTGLLHAPK